MNTKTAMTVLLSGCIPCGAFSCTDMDEYRKISGDEDIVYPGKIEQVVVNTGHERVIVNGICRSDPKIVSCRIYWDLGTRYEEVPVDMSGGAFRIEKEITLPENTYNFDIYTYDAAGNRSVPVNVSSKTYGEQYEASLTNRLVKSFAVQDGKAVIEWWNIETTLGPFETEVVYTNGSAEQVELLVPIGEMTTVLEDYDMVSEVEYTTFYRPDTLCVDVFRSAPSQMRLDGAER